MKNICRDLEAEAASLDTLAAGLDECQWDRITPFGGWTIRDTISHLAYFDGRALLSISDPPAFTRHLKAAFENSQDAEFLFGESLKPGKGIDGSTLLALWRKKRTGLFKALSEMSPDHRLLWYGPPMGARSFATARLMETWAHGQDVADTLGQKRPDSDRLRHIAHLGVVTFGWSFVNRNKKKPDIPVRVDLTAPSGECWGWGPAEAENAVSGSAEAFCLVVTRRRHLADTGLSVRGDVASQWMRIAQAFAGPPESGPAPGAFPP